MSAGAIEVARRGCPVATLNDAATITAAIMGSTLIKALFIEELICILSLLSSILHRLCTKNRGADSAFIRLLPQSGYNKAQGCRAARLPWEKRIVEPIAIPNRVVTGPLETQPLTGFRTPIQTIFPG
jgi:hypothetical protein